MCCQWKFPDEFLVFPRQWGPKFPEEGGAIDTSVFTGKFAGPPIPYFKSPGDLERGWLPNDILLNVLERAANETLLA